MKQTCRGKKSQFTQQECYQFSRNAGHLLIKNRSRHIPS